MEDGSLCPLPQDLTLSDALRSPAYACVRAVYVSGAVTDALLKPVLTAGKRFEGLILSVEDGSKLLIRRGTYDKLALCGISLAVARATRVAAITVNPFSAYGFNFDKDELLSRMQARVNVPVLNVLEDVRVEDMAWHAEDMRRIAAREEAERNTDCSHCCGNEELI